MSGRRFGCIVPVLAAMCGAVCFCPRASAVSLTRLAYFTGTNGENPGAGLAIDSAGDLFGTTPYSTGTDGASVFKIAAGTSTITTVASFSGTNWATPMSDLVLDSLGNLYGTTQMWGANEQGSVFEVPAGSSTIQTLVSFTGNVLNNGNGTQPHAGVILDTNGNIYGTTYGGGPEYFGEIFQIAGGNGNFSILHSLGTNENASLPSGDLIEDGAGNLYGTATSNGSSGNGAVFKYNLQTNTLTAIPFNFTNGENPEGGLVMDKAGNLYGTTNDGGGIDNAGTLYEIAAGTNTITVLATFGPSGDYQPEGNLLLDAAGNLFGTTYDGGGSGYGSVFELPFGSHTIMTLASFNSANGAFPEGGLVADVAGNLYGTAHSGGPAGLNGDGTVFEVSGSGFVVPEPASMTILGAGILLGLSRKRMRYMWA